MRVSKKTVAHVQVILTEEKELIEQSTPEAPRREFPLSPPLSPILGDGGKGRFFSLSLPASPDRRLGIDRLDSRDPHNISGETHEVFNISFCSTVSETLSRPEIQYTAVIAKLVADFIEAHASGRTARLIKEKGVAITVEFEQEFTAFVGVLVQKLTKYIPMISNEYPLIIEAHKQLVQISKDKGLKQEAKIAQGQKILDDLVKELRRIVARQGTAIKKERLASMSQALGDIQDAWERSCKIRPEILPKVVKLDVKRMIDILVAHAAQVVSELRFVSFLDGSEHQDLLSCTTAGKRAKRLSLSDGTVTRPPEEEGSPVSLKDFVGELPDEAADAGPRTVIYCFPNGVEVPVSVTYLEDFARRDHVTPLKSYLNILSRRVAIMEDYSDAQIAQMMQDILNNKDTKELKALTPKQQEWIYSLTVLLFATECQRNDRSYAYNMMALQLVIAGELSWGDLFIDHTVYRPGVFKENLLREHLPAEDLSRRKLDAVVQQLTRLNILRRVDDTLIQFNEAVLNPEPPRTRTVMRQVQRMEPVYTPQLMVPPLPYGAQPFLNPDGSFMLAGTPERPVIHYQLYGQVMYQQVSWQQLQTGTRSVQEPRFVQVQNPAYARFKPSAQFTKQECIQRMRQVLPEASLRAIRPELNRQEIQRVYTELGTIWFAQLAVQTSGEAKKDKTWCLPMVLLGAVRMNLWSLNTSGIRPLQYLPHIAQKDSVPGDPTLLQVQEHKLLTLWCKHKGCGIDDIATVLPGEMSMFYNTPKVQPTKMGVEKVVPQLQAEPNAGIVPISA